MKKVKSILPIVLISISSIGFSQQQAMFTQYMFNGLAINPAYAGSQESITVSATARRQWTGIEGAPQTQTFGVHSPIRNERMALGALFMHDNIGVTNQDAINLMYAYRIPVSDRGRLAFGLQGALTFYNAEFSKVSATDPRFANDVRSITPTVGFGTYYQTDRFYVGFSIPQINQSNLDNQNQGANSKLIRHYFLNAGYVIDINPLLKLKPNVLVKSVAGAPLQVDLNANVLINEIIWLGLSWRSFDSIDALAQFQVSPQLQVGYAYDFATTTSLNSVAGGSHEFMLSYRLANTRSRIVTPRYF